MALLIGYFNNAEKTKIGLNEYYFPLKNLIGVGKTYIYSHSVQRKMGRDKS